MIVSTKGRYALRVMVHFALQNTDRYIPLKEIAEAEEATSMEEVVEAAEEE